MSYVVECPGTTKIDVNSSSERPEPGCHCRLWRRSAGPDPGQGQTTGGPGRNAGGAKAGPGMGGKVLKRMCPGIKSSSEIGRGGLFVCSCGILLPNELIWGICGYSFDFLDYKLAERHLRIQKKVMASKVGNFKGNTTAKTRMNCGCCKVN